MTKVFIGGSRRVPRVNKDVRARIDRIVEQGFTILVGDANGADKAIQKDLQERGYESVEVFHTEGVCRNNLGNWPTRSVHVSKGAKGFQFYAAKDRQMAEEATVGLMLWDGRSVGTLMNVFRLVNRQKKVVLYIVPSKRFTTLRNKLEWEEFLSQCDARVQQSVEEHVRDDDTPSPNAFQASLI